MQDTLLREKLRQECRRLGQAHPLLVKELVVLKDGVAVKRIPLDRELPSAYIGMWEHK